MIQIFLDDMPAIPAENSTVKINAENPFFTKSSTYTMEVELPLVVPENRELFGNIDRHDMHKEQHTFAASLIADNITLLTGTAHITHSDENSVKIQLLGEESSYNYWNKTKELYIDTLDLGDWFHATYPDGLFYLANQWVKIDENLTSLDMCKLAFLRSMYNDDRTEKSDAILVDNVTSGKLPWVAFPTVNASSGLQHNIFRYIGSFRNGNEVKDATLRMAAWDNESYTWTATPQPFIWFIAERIAMATGFSIDREDNPLYTDPFFKTIFIANLIAEQKISSCLPHWSVNKWWTEIENLFGVVISVDYARKKLHLKKRSNFFDMSSRVDVEDVVDSFTCDYNSEEIADISADNVGYCSFDNDRYDLLDESIVKNAFLNYDHADIYELLAWGKSQTQETLDACKNRIWVCEDGRQYIYSAKSNEFVEVNMFRPRIADAEKDSIDIELSFVPCRFVDGEMTVWAYPWDAMFNETFNKTFNKDYKPGMVPFKMLQAPPVRESSVVGTDDMDIDAILSEDEDAPEVTTESSNPIYIAMWQTTKDSREATVSPGISSLQYPCTENFKHPRAWLRQRGSASLTGEPVYEDSPFSLSLNSTAWQTNLASKTLQSSFNINTKVKYCFQFLMDYLPPRDAIFVIRNKKFVCEKIEANVTSVGLDRLITAYFYEIC